MTNIVSFADHQPEKPDFTKIADEMRDITHRLQREIERLSCNCGYTSCAVRAADEMETPIRQLAALHATLSRMVQPFRKTPAQIEAEWKEFDEEFST
jgi:hypothetical protein